MKMSKGALIGHRNGTPLDRLITGGSRCASNEIFKRKKEEKKKPESYERISLSHR